MVDNKKDIELLEENLHLFKRRDFLKTSSLGFASVLLGSSLMASSNVNASNNILSKPVLPPDKRFWYGDNILQFGDWRKPKGEGPFPLAIMIHGGYWRNRVSLDYYGRASEALRNAGIATWNIEYRRIGDEGGGYPGTFLDVASAIDFVSSPEFVRLTGNVVDLKNIIVVGHSAGGHLGLWAASRDQIPQDDQLWTPDPLKIKAVVSLAGVHNLEQASEMRYSDGVTDEFMNGNAKDFPERYRYASPINLIPIKSHVTLIHGNKDENVPIEESTEYLEASGFSENIKFIEIDGADHFHIVDPESLYWEIVERSVLESVKL